MDEKISICIPVYNGAKTILETLKSVTSQTYKDFEIIVVDNASTDNTVELVNSVRDNRIKLYVNEKNIGGGGNLEECKKRASGDYNDWNTSGEASRRGLF